MQGNELTRQEFWENYWDTYPIPAEAKKIKKIFLQNEILRVFDLYLPKDSDLSILEIGGAPGQYLAYMHKTFGYKICCVDYTDAGCKKTLENFNLLHIPGTVYQADIFSDDLVLPQFDIVYSLGFIEHFNDLSRVIESHLKFLKPGGILLIGVPNLRGINRLILKLSAPQVLSTHNLAAMDVRNWASFVGTFGLEEVFKGYVGGFEPAVLSMGYEQRTLLNELLKVSFYALSAVTSSSRVLRGLNSRHISAYVMGVFKKAEH
ncbi:MAG: class I SAM-dependent methyltransferase [Halobacteriota archaeon]